MGKTEVDLPVSGASTWVAMNAAREDGFVAHSGNSWTSDAVDLSAIGKKLDGRVLFQDLRASGASHDVIYRCSGSIVSIACSRREVNVSVYAASIEAAEKVMARLVKWMPKAPRAPNFLDVTFWYYSEQHGPQSYDRQLQAPKWDTIQLNYPPQTRERLASLQQVEPADSGGKLVLWQGEPGTGKTFALRALGEEWAAWCRIHYVLDPEKFFTNGDYLLRVILGNDDLPQVAGAEQRPSWRLVVLEDSGELLAKDAKQQVGQGLSRLLNLCDGLLGQGLRVLVLITTNEQVGTLHSAVSRPGRCLAQIAFEKFDSGAANEWLKAHDSQSAVAKQAALADLYALIHGAKPAEERSAAGFR